MPRTGTLRKRTEAVAIENLKKLLRNFFYDAFGTFTGRFEPWRTYLELLLHV